MGVFHAISSKRIFIELIPHTLLGWMRVATMDFLCRSVHFVPFPTDNFFVSWPSTPWGRGYQNEFYLKTWTFQAITIKIIVNWLLLPGVGVEKVFSVQMRTYHTVSSKNIVSELTLTPEWVVVVKMCLCGPLGDSQKTFM